LAACTLALVVMPMFAGAADPTFYRDVLPILQNRCQECHRKGEMAPMALLSYQEARPWAKAIRTVVLTRKMPPWFADPCCGHFSNDRSLTPAEIDTLTQWADHGAPAGDQKDAPAPREWPEYGNLPSPDLTLGMQKAFEIPAKGAIEYQYFVVPTGFREDRWVQGVEVRPGDRAVVHHAVVYLREPGSTWTSGPTKADILSVYAPGSAPDVWPEGMAKLVKAGSDLVFEIHYTPVGHKVMDRTQVSIKFAKSAPQKRVLTLQMDNERLAIPPGDNNYRVNVGGTLPNDALLISFFPHMHLRGKAFEYNRILSNGQPETLLRVSPYNFYWQLSYRLAQPLALKKGTRLEWTAWFDNSVDNPLNPDPSVEVHYGHQSWDEMMVGFFDLAVDADVDKNQFFVR